ncbi:hypothetical protein LTR66_014534, partial [Elasticomyces elasticus]
NLSLMKLIKSLPNNVQNLPSEIQDLIFDYVICESTTDELKLIRLSNKYFCDRADPFLFKTLHLSASTLSFERMQGIAHVERLAQHVKALVFHRGTFRGHSMASSMRGLKALPYGDFETYMIRSGEGMANMMRISSLYDGFSNEVASEARFHHELTWRSPMRRRLIELFPKLEEVMTCSAEDDLQSKYLLRKTGLTHQSWTPDHFAPYEILDAVGNTFQPKSIWFDSCNGEDIWAAIVAMGDADRVGERLSQLTKLHLSFSETVSALETVGPWTNFAKACTNLKELRLDFSSFYSPKMWKDTNCFARRLSDLFLKQSYHQLNTLRLEDAPLLEHTFVDFFSRHVSSLRCISLLAWHMPATTTQQPTGSIVRAIHRLGQLSFQRLETVHLEGEFSARYDGEGWLAQPRSDDDTEAPCLLNRIARYVLGKAEFPFPTAPTATSMELTENELKYLDESIGQTSSAEDTSFCWHGHIQRADANGLQHH